MSSRPRVDGSQVLVVGSVNRDYVCRAATIPRPGETILGGELSEASGGKGGNQAVAAARLGVGTRLVACVGDDPAGQVMRDDLVAEGVDVTGVSVVAAVRSGAAFVMVADDGDNAILVAPGANDRLDGAQVTAAVRDRLRRDDVLVVQAEIPLTGIVAAVEVARLAAARVVFNLAPYRDVPADLLAVCDPLVVNEGEARALLGAGPGDANDAPEMVRTLGRLARSAVITLGPAGAVVFDGAGIQQIPARRVDVVDTTGAGDAFTGALAAALALGAEPTDAVRLGVAAGSLAVTKLGARSSYPTMADLKGLEHLRDLL